MKSTGEVMAIGRSFEEAIQKAVRSLDTGMGGLMGMGEKDFEIIDEPKLSEKQKTALQFIKGNILEKFGSTGVQQVIDNAVFNLLKYIAVFPGGVSKLEDSEGRILPDCFLIPGGSTALDFAYKLHTDLGDKFIRAVDVRTKLTVGKEHILKNGDVMEIITDK